MIQHTITLLAQQNGELLSADGLYAGSNSALCLDGARGLLALSMGDSPALALEVLQDDMSLNMQQALQLVSGSASGVSLCLQESLDNINEFLYHKRTDTDQGVELGVLQLGNNQLSAYVCGAICAARWRADRLKMICDNVQDQPLPGRQPALKPQLIELDFQVDDLLLLTTQSVFNTLEADFIRLTLARFHDNLHMALRQLNTRAMRNGLAEKPLLILCRIENAIKSGGSNWFKRLRKR